VGLEGPLGQEPVRPPVDGGRNSTTFPIDRLADGTERESEEDFQDQIHRFEKERQLPYVAAIERVTMGNVLERGPERGLERGELRALKQGIEVALELKFGTDRLRLLTLVREVERVEVLRTVQDSIRTTRTLAEVRRLLTRPRPN